MPNITGSTSTTNRAYLGIAVSGAFFKQTINGWLQGDTTGTKGGFAYGFDASRSNAIYGASTHVTPQNSAIQLWQRIS